MQPSSNEREPILSVRPHAPPAPLITRRHACPVNINKAVAPVSPLICHNCTQALIEPATNWHRLTGTARDKLADKWPIRARQIRGKSKCSSNLARAIMAHISCSSGSEASRMDRPSLPRGYLPSGPLLLGALCPAALPSSQVRCHSEAAIRSAKQPRYSLAADLTRPVATGPTGLEWSPTELQRESS